MPGKTKCYDLTQEALSDVKRAVYAQHRQDGVVDEEEAYIEELVEEACRSARLTATFVRAGVRILGGGAINSGLLVQIRACDEERAARVGEEDGARARWRASITRRACVHTAGPSMTSSDALRANQIRHEQG